VTTDGAGTLAAVAMSDDGDPLARLNRLLDEVRIGNEFQAKRLPDGSLDSLDDLAQLPFTTKDELLADQAENPPFGTNLTYELDRYSLLFQTSGSTGSPLKLLDTAEDWDWWRRCFTSVWRAAGLGPSDRIALAYSFGPYVQFWGSYEATKAINALTLPLGGMGSLQRLETVGAYAATAVACTPSYALHLARRAIESDRADALRTVERIICTGEPGASLPSVRDEIESRWGARCLDHAGLSEVGAFAYPCPAGGGIHLNEDQFLFEVIDPHSGDAVAEGELGELVVTALGRRGFPALRYRTGDAVRIATEQCPDEHHHPWVPAGIIGRTDDMVVIRGMNVYPSAIEEILREVGGVGEFRIVFYTDTSAMDEVKVEAELDRAADAREIQERMRTRLGLRVRIVPVKPGVLPVRDRKVRRVEDTRERSGAAG
jgi:phenylacetate-CoA ligase